MATPQPFMPAGQSYYRNPAFNLHHPASTSSIANGNPTLPQSTFRAPAHRHAHHLHSIPPREKSTRTLILDHMLWVHGRTRFSQARAELGMTDRTGGSNSLNYEYRTRPERYEEDDEEDSEGEEVIALKARTGDPNHPMNDGDDRFRRQDLALARTLRLRAEDLEKVITSMLDQPPPIHPLTDDDHVSTDNHPNLKDLHRLPNGVRLRLALGTIVNDLFARQPFHPPYRHTHPPQTPKPTHASAQEYSSPSDLPHVLRPLAPISGAFAPRLQQPPHQPSPSPMALHSPAYSDYTAQYSQPSPNQPGSVFQSFNPQPSLSERKSLPRPTQRTRQLYFNGSDPSTANCPPALRCPRHLQNGCEICTEDKSTPRPAANNARGRTGQRPSVSSPWKAPASAGGGSAGLSGWQEGTGIGSGLLRPAVRGSALRRTVIENDMTAGAGNTKLSKLIPRFLRLSALVAAELGREARGEEVDSSSEDGRANAGGGVDNEATGAPAAGGVGASPPSGNVSTPGWSGGNNNAGGAGGYVSVPSSPNMRRTRQLGQSSPENQARERARMYEKALRPSREWYMLLAGLLTRAVLEGYLTAGWSGLQAVQCLLLVGLGINENLGVNKDADDEEDEEAPFSSLDPDELPDLTQAVKILFPSSRAGSFGVRDLAEEEYELEMLERLKRFYDIPLSTQDCSIHMEGLAWKYPAENVERAAVRYCEAIARWRGKPELETYKKKPLPRTTTAAGSAAGAGAGADLGGSTPGGGPSPMTIESLVHSNPTSPDGRKLRKPSIDVYFPRGHGGAGGSSPLVSTSTLRGPSGAGAGGGWIPIRGNNNNGSSSNGNSNKRYREADDVGRDDSKRLFTA